MEEVEMVDETLGRPIQRKQVFDQRESNGELLLYLVYEFLAM